MPEAWRIVKARHAVTAFTGEGAARTGGRWNSRGAPIVYASGAKSLAVLESLVHLNPPVLFRYAAFYIRFDQKLAETVTHPPTDWQTQPPGPATKMIGDAWVREKRSAVLQVPSIIVPEELNYLLNPAHRDFGRITISKPQPFVFDPRLLA